MALHKLLLLLQNLKKKKKKKKKGEGDKKRNGFSKNKTKQSRDFFGHTLLDYILSSWWCKMPRNYYFFFLLFSLCKMYQFICINQSTILSLSLHFLFLEMVIAVRNRSSELNKYIVAEDIFSKYLFCHF